MSLSPWGDSSSASSSRPSPSIKSWSSASPEPEAALEMSELLIEPEVARPESPMLGGGGGRIKGGRNLDYLGKPDRQMCRLFLSMMDKMDVHPKTFGDANKPLGEV